MASHTDDELRQKARNLVARCEVDPEFARRAKADPAAVLREAGLPEDLVRTDRKPYKWALCADFTCIVSGCPECCYVTANVSDV
jgi:hypothetical protein